MEKINKISRAGIIEIKCNQADNLKMGRWCFPNKKILRNSPCLPACKQKNIKKSNQYYIEKYGELTEKATRRE